jgi:uncharacterized protein with PQ loop repeat
MLYVKTIFGILASIFSISTLTPQVIHTIKTKKTSDLSLYNLILGLLCIYFWLGYGILDESIPLIITEIILIPQETYLLCAKIYYDKLLCFKKSTTDIPPQLENC